MQNVKRVEIVTDAREMREVRGALERAGVSGYTLIPQVQGRGERGEQSGDDLSDALSNAYLLVACEPHQVEAIVDIVRPILARRGGVCLVSDALWVKH